RNTRRRQTVVRMLALAGVGLALVVGVLSAMRRFPSFRSPAEPSTSNAPILPTGSAADWAHVFTVLMLLPAPVHCLVVLPDRRTIRLVWGVPAHADDVDLTTGGHRPSALVPAAYHEGCPDLSANGKLVFHGYLEDGRPFVFVSPHTDGSDAKPI